ncbi:hypothetical protein WJX73_000094 [Symbiochloris irregularis]|uniref:Cwf15/Cwc15 cell cycle control protein n=1 Tax=Symbiochloris irregularis TaxID=706552 RepID=A0AAW1P088_9CHLO
MTTAHRPTWAPAKGGEEQGGTRIFAPSRQFSAKDQPSHQQLKHRQTGQASASDTATRDLKAELLEREHKHDRQKKLENFEEERESDLKLLSGPEGTSAGPAKMLVPKAIDADDVDDEDEDSSESDDDEDDEAALMAELARIRKERAEEAQRKAAQEAAEKQEALQQEVAAGNPLLNQPVDFQVKRRWDDDVVFRNQTRGEPKAQKRFINDTIRNDFHRRFLSRYIK